MTRKITLLAIVPVLTLGLSACGSSGTDAGSSPTSSSMSSMNMASSSSSGSGSSPSSSTSESKDAGADITISDFAYKVPASVAPGTTITIKNGDSQAHTVTSKEGGFDVTVDPNGTATMKAPDKPGSYKFVCTFHANMSSTLVVK